MIVLLDENFPLGLLRSLQNDGLSAQHIITLGWLGEASRAIVVLSRVRQSRLLKDRIEIWRHCVRELLQASKPERLYELMDNGALLPWRDTSSDTSSDT